MSDALFVPSGDAWLPTELARGPWSPDALHGGPVAALVARAVEGCEADPAMHVARLTVELLRPVPLADLQLSAAVTRPGRKVQVVECSVAAQGQPVAWARAVRIRTRPAPAPSSFDPPPVEPGAAVSGPGAARADAALVVGAGPSPTPTPIPGVDPRAPRLPEVGQRTPSFESGYRGFHNAGAELRFVSGRFDELGPSQVWVRLAVPVVPGEEPSPLQRAAGAADFGNGVSAVLPFDGWVFINPDLTVAVERPPVGEWVCLAATTRLGSPGVALAHSTLWDTQGRVGFAFQNLVVEPRP